MVIKRVVLIAFMVLTLLIVSVAFLGAGAFSGAAVFFGKGLEVKSEPTGFSHHVVDAVGPRAPWGKTVGDINGDGLIDLVVGGHQRSEPSLWGRVLRKLGKGSDSSIKGDLVWYQNPGWQKHLISNRFATRTDLEVGDLNNDKNNDLAVLTDSGLIILWGPNWRSTQIDTARLHDIELADFDRDGDLDMVARSQSLFNHNNGNVLFFYRQDSPQQWQKISVPIEHGEGLAQADMNADGLQDVIVNRYWLENPGQLNHKTSNVWQAREYASQWHWDHVFIDTGDFNNDGLRDVLLSPAEEAGQFYQISWFQAPADKGQWQQHIIDSGVEAVHHFVAAADINKDGLLDVLTAEMNHGDAANDVKAYINTGNGTASNGILWEKIVLGSNASHSMQILDVDGDMDIDVFGANWQIKHYKGDYAVGLWINQIVE